MDQRYKLRRLLGQGGMAEVYLGVASGAEGFERPVAIKRVLPHLARDERVAKMFLAEAKLASLLNHQNIVQVLDVGRGPDGLFIVMELINGWDLGVVLQHAQAGGHRVPPELVGFIGSQVAAGLAHAYRKTLDGRPVMVAHRDVSLSNVLVSAEGEVKVADFGIAKVEGFSTATEPGMFKGKIAYAAPEVLRGEAPTAASDQFGLGVSLYELLTERHPYGDPEQLAPYVNALTHSEPAPFDGPPLLAQVVRRLLASDPAGRFKSIDEVARAFSVYLAQTGIPGGANELAAFLERLSLPPKPLDGAKDATLPGSGGFSLSMPATLESFNSTGEWQAPGAVMDEEGRLLVPVDQAAKRAARAERPPAPVPAAPVVEKLELAYERKPDPEGGRIDPFPASEARRFPKWPFALLAVLCLLAGVGFILQKGRFIADRLPTSLPGQPHVLQIDSDPSGAIIRVNGTQIGQTPLFIENTYPPGGEIPVQISLRGYRTWSGTFRGGEAVKIDATLTHRSP